MSTVPNSLEGLSPVSTGVKNTNPYASYAAYASELKIIHANLFATTSELSGKIFDLQSKKSDFEGKLAFETQKRDQITKIESLKTQYASNKNITYLKGKPTSKSEVSAIDSFTREMFEVQSEILRDILAAEMQFKVSYNDTPNLNDVEITITTLKEAIFMLSEGIEQAETELENEKTQAEIAMQNVQNAMSQTLQQQQSLFSTRNTFDFLAMGQRTYDRG